MENKELNECFYWMKKLNPDFKMLSEADTITQQPSYRFKTYGDLKKLVNVIKLKQKGTKLAGIAGDALVDEIAGKIPGFSLAKSAFDIYKAAFTKPDNIKTNTWLDKLDIDDKTSAIVDDTVENGFLQSISKMFDAEPDDKQLEPDFNMNDKLAEYLSSNYDSRTVTGYIK